VAATKAGARFNDPHDATVGAGPGPAGPGPARQANKVGTAQDVIEQRAYFQFYMHRTGHWLGMDVHDCGSYVEPSRWAR
jgi:Xaa-Pro aminopeptidase